MPRPAISKTANTDSISRLNSRPKLPFPGNGKGNYKMPREGKFEVCIPGNHGKRDFPLTPGFGLKSSAGRRGNLDASGQSPILAPPSINTS